MDASTKALFDQAVQAAQQRDRETARSLIERVLVTDPDYAPGWLWMAALTTELDKQILYLKRALQLNRNYTEAQKYLADLEIQMLVQAPISTEQPPGEDQLQKTAKYFLSLGLISHDQLLEALKEYNYHRCHLSRNVKIEDILRSRGWVTEEGFALVQQTREREELQRHTQKVPGQFSEFLVFERVITAEQFDTALREQARQRRQGRVRPVEEICVELGFVSAQQLSTLKVKFERAIFNVYFGD